MKKKLVIFGNGSMAKGLYLGLRTDPDYEVAAFCVDEAFLTEPQLFGLAVLPFNENLVKSHPPDEFFVHIAIGYARVNQVRAERFSQAKAWGYRLSTHFSPLGLYDRELLQIGENCFVGPQVLISPTARIGNNVVIGANCVIPHDVKIEDHCFLSTNVVLGGGVTLQPYCYLGANATLRNWITIGRSCVIGVGAVILDDTQAKEVYMARPAEKLPISSDDLPLK